MDFNLSDEQQMLADSVRRWLGTDYPFEARRRFAATAAGFGQGNWERLAELGLLGLQVPAEYGGLGSDSTDTAIVMQELGRALAVEPFVSTAVVGASLLARAGTEAQKTRLLPGVVAGATRLALAALEPGGRYDLSHVSTRAQWQNGSYVIDGRKAVVLHGDTAHTLIVSARVSGGTTDPEGIALFLVDPLAAGVQVKGFPTLDGQRAAEVELRAVTVDVAAMLGSMDTALELLEWGVDRGLAALCAEAVGVMERLMEMTVEHLRTRKQFGQAIGQFQSLQHRAADMLIAIEQARSMALLAAAKVDDPDPIIRRRALSAAKVMIGRSGRYVGQQAVQLHGGMGMTDELPVGYYFKRLTCIDMTWGDVEHHLERYGDPT